MRDNSFIVIQSWMISDLHLSGNDLIVYATIYGFSQDGTSNFHGSLDYLAEWCNSTARSIKRNLNNLIEKGLIQEELTEIRGKTFHDYFCTSCAKVAQNVPKLHKMSAHNIDNNIVKENIDILSKDKIPESPTTVLNDYDSHAYSPEELKEDFLGSLHKKPKQKRVSLYDKCVDETYLFTKNLALQDALISYLSVRLHITDKPLRGVNQWKGMLNKLRTFSNSDVELISIVEQSIEHGWASFYELKKTPSKIDAYSEWYNADVTTVVAENKEEKKHKLKNAKIGDIVDGREVF